MAKFTKSLFGYNKEKVLNHIDDLEKTHNEFISGKRKEIIDFKEKIVAIQESNNELWREIEEKNRKRNYLFNTLNEEISKIESKVKEKQNEVDLRNNLALERLIKKKNNLLEIQSYIKNLHKNLEMIKEDSELVEKLYD